MKKLYGILIILGSVAAANATTLGTYFNDDFSGASLNAATWNSGGNVSVGSSLVTMDAGPAGTWSYISSQTNVNPVGTEKAILSVTGIAHTPWSQWSWLNFLDGMGLGFSNPDGQNGITVGIKEDLSHQLYLRMTDAGAPEQFAVIGSDGLFQGNLSIEWSASKVLVLNGATVLFDTSVTGPNGGGSWNLPTAPIAVYAGTYYAGSTLSFDSMSLEVISMVPEPSTLALLSLGGLLLLRRKNCRV